MEKVEAERAAGPVTLMPVSGGVSELLLVLPPQTVLPTMSLPQVRAAPPGHRPTFTCGIAASDSVGGALSHLAGAQGWEARSQLVLSSAAAPPCPFDCRASATSWTPHL